MKNPIKVNAARCTNCGDLLCSVHVYDWTCCSCFEKSDGNTGIYIDGGFDYMRWGGKPEHMERIN